jgi:hypothetical protein
MQYNEVKRADPDSWQNGMATSLVLRSCERSEWCELSDKIMSGIREFHRFQWPRSLKSVAARQLRLWGRIPPGVWMFVCCELSGRGICDELITRPEESYRLWCVAVCDPETNKTEAMVRVRSQRHRKKQTWHFSDLFKQASLVRT